ncbi:hypothetical protein NDU88_005735 [Pleurodeles waltl]|uniref:Uncharacterized protein n=1 Tax=Pleurodeles waltl TaxID=8319 RepID=A0AAV7WVI6_PLEWA|nr:hypothetical protein NDU88_005735 [Pleurodeles waltl]
MDLRAEGPAWRPWATSAATVVHDKAAGTPAQQKIGKYAKQNVFRSEVGAIGRTNEPESATQTVTILHAISDLKVTMEEKMGELKVDVTLIRQDPCNSTNRVTEVEGRLSEMEDTVK